MYIRNSMTLTENRLVKYIISAKSELKKVSWPTKKETTKHTLIVIGISVFTALFLGALDFIFTKLLALVI